MFCHWDAAATCASRVTTQILQKYCRGPCMWSDSVKPKLGRYANSACPGPDAVGYEGVDRACGSFARWMRTFARLSRLTNGWNCAATQIVPHIHSHAVSGSLSASTIDARLLAASAGESAPSKRSCKVLKMRPSLNSGPISSILRSCPGADGSRLPCLPYQAVRLAKRSGSHCDGICFVVDMIDGCVPDAHWWRVAAVPLAALHCRLKPNYAPRSLTILTIHVLTCPS